jgi:hypothetical protein
MSRQCEYCLCIDDLDIDLIIEYSYDAGSPAKLSGHPDSWEPEDPGYIDIDRVLYKNSGKEIDFQLTEHEIEAMEDYIVELESDSVDFDFDI